MSATRVSVLVPLIGRSVELPSTIETIEQYLEANGFEFDVRVVDSRDGDGYGAMLRRGASEAKGQIVVVVDAELPYPVSAIGDVVAHIDSGACDVVFAARRATGELTHALTRALLTELLPDPALHLKAFSSEAARVLFGEAKRNGGGFDLEVAFLADKYGFRVERLMVPVTPALKPKNTFGTISALIPIIAIRMTDRRMGYRAARRCPVCFSHEVWSWAQIPGNVIRSCSRCKCRYLAIVPEADETQPVRRVLRAHAAAAMEPVDEERSATSREKTSVRRLNALRDYLGSRARLLEIGVRDGSFGAAAQRELEYVGIDPSAPTARSARARGLEVYCSSLASFVNTGPAFDAIALFHVFENMSEPHDALARIKDLLKPGGALFLTTLDTESFLDLMWGRKRTARTFRTHRILYSRSALIELLEHSGFEIVSIGPDFQYRDQKFLRHVIASRWPLLAPLASAAMAGLPDPLLVASSSIRVLARRRAGPPLGARAIRSVEPTHAR